MLFFVILSLSRIHARREIRICGSCTGEKNAGTFQACDSPRSVAKNTFVQSIPSLSRSQGRCRKIGFGEGLYGVLTGDVDKREGRRQNIYPTSNMVEWIASGVSDGTSNGTRDTVCVRCGVPAVRASCVRMVAVLASNVQASPRAHSSPSSFDVRAFRTSVAQSASSSASCR